MPELREITKRWDGTHECRVYLSSDPDAVEKEDAEVVAYVTIACDSAPGYYTATAELEIVAMAGKQSRRLVTSDDIRAAESWFDAHKDELVREHGVRTP